MAEGKKNAKQYWAAIALATALAETAHAPLRGNAASADVRSTSAANAVAANSRESAEDKKLPPAKNQASIPDLILPQNTPNPPLELARINPFPLLGLPPLPESAAPATPDSEAQAVSLLNSGGDSLAGTTPTEESDPTPATESPVAPGNPFALVPTNPPIVGTPVLGEPNPITAVPEPGCVSLFIGGMMLLGRRRYRA